MHTRRSFISCLAALPVSVQRALGAFRSIPREPVEIGGVPQFFIDDYIVDNRWAVNFERGSPEMVLRVFHQPVKHPSNPLIMPKHVEPLNLPQPGPSWFSVLHDPKSGMFRMWYQDNQPKRGVNPGKGEGIFEVAVCYAESKDGLHWNFPKLNLLEWRGNKDNNVVWRGLDDKNRGAEQQIVTQIPKEARRGYEYVMLYLSRGLHLIGSHDGIHWDKSSDVKVHYMASDFPNNILYDPVEKEFVMYCRAKQMYRVGRGDILDTGESRRIARMTSKELWTSWTDQPQNILLADELDNVEAFNHFYAMMVQRHAGIYWGFLHPFKWNTDIHAELAFSRDGLQFDRLPTRPKLIPRGPEGSWDSGLIFTNYNWMEVGDEWWLYYNGWDGPHGATENVERGHFRIGGIGLATIQKERFISMRGPKNGGVAATRRITWPGGGLFINADARGGELKVRVSDEYRKVIPGFDYKDCATLTDDKLQHEVRWRNASIASMKGKIVRLEFFLKEADIYTFRAGVPDMSPAD
jgi:hypothetical protein